MRFRNEAVAAAAFLILRVDDDFVRWGEPIVSIVLSIWQGIAAGRSCLIQVAFTPTAADSPSIRNENPQTSPVGLIQATDGNLYGTTVSGGAHDSCHNGGSPVACGSVFKITLTGTLTTLHSFDGTDGTVPNGLLQATNGNFYGTTLTGANDSCYFYGSCGTVFEITPSGKLTTLHSFDSTDGANPNFLVQDTNGSFYGTTGYGGDLSCPNPPAGCGTVFRLSVGLGPFVETQTTSGKVGEAVKILGTDLTGATKVPFNGTAAVFKVVSSSLITTTIPRDATSGKVRVTTPHGTLSSNVSFRVTP